MLLESPWIFSKSWTGPFSIMNVHENGTGRIQKGIVSERVDIYIMKMGINDALDIIIKTLNASVVVYWHDLR
jgi:hypothetical protein